MGKDIHTIFTYNLITNIFKSTKTFREAALKKVTLNRLINISLLGTGRTWDLYDSKKAKASQKLITTILIAGTQSQLLWHDITGPTLKAKQQQYALQKNGCPHVLLVEKRGTKKQFKQPFVRYEFVSSLKFMRQNQVLTRI